MSDYEHADQEILVRVASGASPEGPHLAGCQQCQAEVAGWQAVLLAVRAAEDPVEVPAFATLVAPALRLAVSPFPPRPALLSSARLAGLVAARQAKVMARAIGPLTVIGSVIAVLLALQLPASRAVDAFTSTVCLVALLGTLAICVPRRDPRRELFASLPVSPVSVVLSRMVLVLGLDLVLAFLGSFLVAGQAGVSVVSVISSWLGPCLLASGAALLLSVWRSAALGAVVGGVLWLVGTLASLGRSPSESVPRGAPGVLVEQFWSTSEVSLLLAAVLLVSVGLVTGHTTRHGLISN